MTPADQEVMQHIYQKQRESFAPAILAEIDKRRDQLAAASPAGHLRFLHDACAAAARLRRHSDSSHRIALAEARHPRRSILLDALVSPAISHVEVDSQVTLRDRLALVHWMACLIREARKAGDNRRAMETPSGVWLAPAVGNGALNRSW